MGFCCGAISLTKIERDDLTDVELGGPLLGARTQNLSNLIDYDELNILHELGRGSSGAVQLATYNGQFVAVKSVSDDVNKFLAEVKLMSSLPAHKNLVTLVGYCAGARRRAIVMVRP